MFPSSKKTSNVRMMEMGPVEVAKVNQRTRDEKKRAKEQIAKDLESQKSSESIFSEIVKKAEKEEVLVEASEKPKNTLSSIFSKILSKK